MANAQEKRESRSRSIARRINLGVWLDKLRSFLVLDIAAAIVLFILFAAAECGLNAENGWKGDHGRVIWAETSGTSWEDSGLMVRFKDGTETILLAADYARSASPLLSVLAVLEAFDLLGTLSNTYRIRRRLRPLELLAEQAEALSRMPIRDKSFENLEQAILEANPDAGEPPIISTGNEDLKSIENALNSLLKRQQESYRQQVRFVSDASHELRTPIAVIQGYANMLDRWGKDDPEILQEGISSILQESEHMKDLVEQLLFLARSDSDRNVLQKKNFDMTEMMEEVYDETCMIDPDHAYVFSGQPEGTDTALTGDPGMIKQSVRVFLQNAQKYSEKGGTIRLSVEVRRNEEEKVTAVGYGVTDEGIGMEQEDVAHIFERFYRSDRARNSQTGGSGLGLSVAKWIIDAHGGRIDVVSRPDFGTRFVVLFPVQGGSRGEAADTAG